MSILLQVFE